MGFIAHFCVMKEEKMEYLNEYKKWCTSNVFGEETKKELLNIKNDNKER